MKSATATATDARASAMAADRHARESRRLATLLEVSQALSGTLNLKSAFHKVLEILAKHHGAVRSMVTLLGEDGELTVEASDGLDKPAQHVRYRVGEGITGRVVETAKPVVVPRVSQEPNLAPPPTDRARSEQRELSFVAVPIILGRRPTGTMEVVLPFKSDRDYQRSLEFYKVVASMIARVPSGPWDSSNSRAVARTMERSFRSRTRATSPDSAPRSPERAAAITSP